MAHLKNTFLIKRIGQGLFLLSMAACLQVTAQAQNKIKNVPVPAKNPKVIKAQRTYEKTKSDATAAQKMVTQERMAFQRMMRQTGSAALMSKPQSLIEAENKLMDLQAQLEQLAADKLETLDDQNLYDLIARVQQLQLDLKTQQAKTELGEASRALTKLTMQLTAAESELRRYEKSLLMKQSDYVSLVEKYETQKREVQSMQRQFAIERKATQGAKQNNPELQGKKQQIDNAVQAYSAAYKRQQASRKELNLAIKQATVEYQQFLYKKEEQRKKDLQKNAKRRNRRGYGVRRVRRGHSY